MLALIKENLRHDLKDEEDFIKGMKKGKLFHSARISTENKGVEMARQGTWSSTMMCL
jgi:hypothetical protein